MPNIIQFNANAGEAPQPTDMAANTAREAGAVINRFGRESGSAVGSAIGSLGRPVQELVNDAQNHVDQQQIGHFSATSTQLYADLMGKLNTAMATADPNDMSVAQGFNEKLLEPALENLQKQYEDSSERVRNHVLATTDNMRKEFSNHVAAQDMIRAQSAWDQNVHTEYSYLAKSVNDVPSSLPYALDKLRFDANALIGGYSAKMGAAGAAKARASIDAFAGGLTASAFQGMIDKNPQGAQAWYADPKNEDAIATMNPAHRLALEGELKRALLPIEIKNAADKITGPPSKLLNMPDARGIYNLSAPDDASASDLAANLDAQGKKFSISVGDETPTNPRDMKVRLAGMEAKAEEVYPNDPVKRDLLINQIKSNVTRATVALQAQVNQASDTVMKIARPPDGSPGALDLGDITNTPAGRRAYDQLDLPHQEAVLKVLEQNQNRAIGKPAQIDAAVKQQAWNDILDGKITQPSEIHLLAKQGLTHRSDDEMQSALIKFQSGGAAFMKEQDGIQRRAAGMLRSKLDAATLLHPDFAIAAGEAYRYELNRLIQSDLNADPPRNPRDRFVVGSPNYALDTNFVSSFMPSPEEIKRIQAGAVKPAAATAGIEHNGFRFPNQKALDKYKADGGK